MIEKYRKKPVYVEALQWKGNNPSEICKFMHKDVGHLFVGGALYITEKDKIIHVNVGDYIIKGSTGNFCACDPDAFEKSYEEINMQKKILDATCGSRTMWFNKTTRQRKRH